MVKCEAQREREKEETMKSIIRFVIKNVCGCPRICGKYPCELGLFECKECEVN